MLKNSFQSVNLMGGSIFFQQQWIKKNISLESVKNWRRHHDVNQNHIDGKLFIGSLYDMKV